MADGDVLLLDTHVVLWWLVDSPELKPAVRRRIADPAARVLVSAASGWEVTTKARLGKLPGMEHAAARFAGLVTEARFEALPITMAHACAAGALGGDHHDPFDRMLIAQAMVEELTVVTRDPVFRAYRVKTLSA